MATAWPAVVGYLLAALPTLPGWSQVAIYDGPPVSADVPTDYVTVGFVDGNLAGNYTQTSDPDGFSIQETGTVRCSLSCVTEQIDLAGARVRVFALVDALAAVIRVNRRLGGVLSPQGTVDLVVDVQSIQNPTGAAASVVFALNYLTIT